MCVCSEQGSASVHRTLPCELEIALNAHKNARKHYDTRKWAAAKEQKTVNASKKAIKSAKIRTAEALKQVTYYSY
jgi:hypothetical protein